MEIPFHKPYITDDEIDGVVDSIRSGWLTMGPKTLKFEQEFAGYTGAEYSVAVNSCTAALHLALKAIDLKPGDEVIIPSMTFTATGEVVCYFNAVPIIVDVEKNTHNIDFFAIERAITSRTRAIIPVHFAGQPCDMDEIMQLADKYRLTVIEDAAHSLPAWYKERKVGTIGDMTCFSFYATKTLSTGEGGMVTTGKNEWSERIRILRLHGISRDAWKRYSKEGSWYYEVTEAGYKYNMTDIQAALGLAQLKKAEWMRDRREDIARKYSEAFNAMEGITIPDIRSDRISAWHLYVIKLDTDILSIDRDAFIEALKARGIGTSVHFIPLYRHPFYRNTFGCAREDFPNSEWLFSRIVSLPIYPGMLESEINGVIEAISDIIEAHKR
jgi:perosamine synthetase